ncbi:unnamed protein product [Caenorhabditis auriculariae]|uniref:Uncharacterized protein n=1 Tax=Caenorhabditis auriculariae TaxID=2777116 RepID=A0A8S1HAG7_9PELO|nr:unnamed protein product [Caenorhabditis auriculariae]
MRETGRSRRLKLLVSVATYLGPCAFSKHCHSPEAFFADMWIRVLLTHAFVLSQFTFAHQKRQISFTVEEGPTNGSSRHFHAIRHSRGKVIPYKSATGSVMDPRLNRLESFSLNCPHVSDAASKDVQVEVTWTLNETVWLKIENGEKKVANKLSTFNKRRVGGKAVLRVLLNNGRYLFDYDELTGDFAMEVTPVTWPEDVGSWQCHVTVLQSGNTHTLTSRRRIKAPLQVNPI